MKFTIDRKALINLLKQVNHRDFGMTGRMDKNRWLRIAACAGQIGLSANGVAGITRAEIIEEGVCFIWYGKLLKILQSFKQPEITMEVSPGGITIETFSIGHDGWTAIYDKPELAPQTIEDVTVTKGAGASFVSATWWQNAVDSDWLPGFDPAIKFRKGKNLA